MSDDKQTVNNVPTKSAALSKINWTQAVTLIAMILTMFGISVTPEQQADILAGVTAISTIATVIFRTWFNNTVSPPSVDRAGNP